MSLYIPNAGEMDALKAILASREINLGLYRNQIIPDGNTTIDTLQELPTGGGRGYALKTLAMDLTETAEAASKWWLYMNASGKAEAQYGLAAGPQEWVMAAPDVADGYSVYGAFGYCWAVPFDAGAVEFKVGDWVKGVTSGAIGQVTQAVITAGTWGAAAAGSLFIKTKSGTFQNDENLTKLGVISTVAVVVGGTGYAVGDIVTVTQTGAAGAKLVVSSINAGVVTGLVIVDGGMKYSVATPLATVKVTGAGNDDLTVNVSALATTTYAVSNTGATADAHKRLVFVDAFSEGHAIDTVGLKIQYTPKISMSTA